jgi:predicted permease
MAREMHGDSDLAVAAISFSTLFSALTFFLWLSIVG